MRLLFSPRNGWRLSKSSIAAAICGTQRRLSAGRHSADGVSDLASLAWPAPTICDMVSGSPQSPTDLRRDRASSSLAFWAAEPTARATAATSAPGVSQRRNGDGRLHEERGAVVRCGAVHAERGGAQEQHDHGDQRGDHLAPPGPPGCRCRPWGASRHRRRCPVPRSCRPRGPRPGAGRSCGNRGFGAQLGQCLVQGSGPCCRRRRPSGSG